MAKLSLFQVTRSQLDSVPVTNGQLVVSTDTGEAFLDWDNNRISLGSSLAVVSSLPLAPVSMKLYLVEGNKLYVYDGNNWQNITQPRTLVSKSSLESFPTIGDESNIYFAKDTNRIYRYEPSTSSYINMGDIDQYKGTIQPSQIDGVLNISQLPKEALGQVITVPDDKARFALTSSDVKVGDIVRVGDNDKSVMYIVTNENKLNVSDGYIAITSASAGAVNWDAVESKPDYVTHPATDTQNGYMTSADHAILTQLKDSIGDHNISESVTNVEAVDNVINVTKANGQTFSSTVVTIKQYASLSGFPSVGSNNIAYIDKSTNKTYRWDDNDLKYYCIGSDYGAIQIINGGGGLDNGSSSERKLNG